MEYLNLKGTDIRISNVAVGCMRIPSLQLAEAEAFLGAALDEGINFFDHADIYGGGESERLFAKALPLSKSKRETIYLQSKCGIQRGFFDFSKKHILESVDGILQRLDTDYLDMLLLHRPDTLVEPEEVGEAFAILEEQKKVKYFGVSNHTPNQIALLQKYTKSKIAINQMQLSLAHTPLIDSGLALNMHVDQSINRDSGTLDYCRLEDILIQTWSPFQKKMFGGTFLNDMEEYKELNELLEQLAQTYGVTKTGIAVSWITSHPAHMQVILGTMNVKHLKESCEGAPIKLTRSQWYGLYCAAGNMLP